MAEVQSGKPKLHHGTACDQCFRLKTRCKGEQPICGRCQKTQATCTYSTGAAKRAKTSQKLDTVNEDSAPNASDRISNQGQWEQDDPTLPCQGQSMLQGKQLLSLDNSADSVSDTLQMMKNVGAESQWWKSNEQPKNDGTGMQHMVTTSTVDAQEGLGSPKGTRDSNKIHGADSSFPSWQTLPEIDVTSCQSGYPTGLGDHHGMGDIGAYLREGMFESVASIEAPLGATISTSTTGFPPSSTDPNPDQRLDVDSIDSGLPPGDIIRGLFDNELETLRKPIMARLQSARRGLALVLTFVERHGIELEKSSTSMALASVTILQLVLTCYNDIRMQLAQPENMSVVSDSHSGAFQLEGDMCNRVVETIVCKELESCCDLTQRLRRWIDNISSSHDIEGTDILSAFLYGVETRLKQ